MSGPLNVQPQGLLSFFDLKTGGRYPVDLGELLQPTFDLSRWYLDTSALERVGGTYAAIAVDQNSTSLAPLAQMTVPAGEWWFVRHCWCQAQVSGAGNLLWSVQPFVQPPPIGTANPFFPPCNSVSDFPLDYTGYSVTAQPIESIVAFNEPILIQPGSALTVRHGGFEFAAGTGLVISIAAMILRLRA